MSALKIIKPGLLTSIQDLGRIGSAYYAVPRSGAADENAARIALLLLNKDSDSALIECTSLAPTIEFTGSEKIVLTGADFGWTLNGEIIHRNTVLSVKSGDILQGKFAREGMRGYLAVAGDLEVDTVLGSVSTYPPGRFGGHQGRILQKGDIIPCKASFESLLQSHEIPVKTGPEFHFLEPSEREAFFLKTFKISPDSNRMGARLTTDKPIHCLRCLDSSVPVLPGFIQLPPAGMPIVVLQDGQTTGGYPRIFYIPRKFLSKFNQIPLGGTFKFVLQKEIHK